MSTRIKRPSQSDQDPLPFEKTASLWGLGAPDTRFDCGDPCGFSTGLGNSRATYQLCNLDDFVLESQYTIKGYSYGLMVHWSRKVRLNRLGREKAAFRIWKSRSTYLIYLINKRPFIPHNVRKAFAKWKWDSEWGSEWDLFEETCLKNGTSSKNVFKHSKLSNVRECDKTFDTLAEAVAYRDEMAKKFGIEEEVANIRTQRRLQRVREEQLTRKVKEDFRTPRQVVDDCLTRLDGPPDYDDIRRQMKPTLIKYLVHWFSWAGHWRFDKPPAFLNLKHALTRWLDSYRLRKANTVARQLWRAESKTEPVKAPKDHRKPVKRARKGKVAARVPALVEIDEETGVQQEQLQITTLESLSISTSTALPLSQASPPSFQAESTIGGSTTCIICFSNEKSHAAVPCGHMCICLSCSARLSKCPYCMQPAVHWMQVRVV
jgi:hypothetical protein